MKDISQVVKALEQIDVGFYCTHEALGWRATVPLSAEEILQYAKDPIGHLAAYYGMLKSEYLAWHKSEYIVHFAGKTCAGKSCKNIVEGGFWVRAQCWLELQGSYCHVHL
ncbi:MULTISPECIES: hypothetical protein [Pectobacterium]|uniref:hypothetical protein n=1 Tax=Pectobacterium TaxID=122277 RepID=UPI0013C462B7|nr:MULTISPECIES: hypothetical protein [Pectobacterium]